MGGLLNFELTRGLGGVDLGGSGSFVSRILDPAARARMPPETVAQIQLALADALRLIYVVPIVCAFAGLALILWKLKFPAGSVQDLGVTGLRPRP